MKRTSRKPAPGREDDIDQEGIPYLPDTMPHAPNFFIETCLDKRSERAAPVAEQLFYGPDRCLMHIPSSVRARPHTPRNVSPEAFDATETFPAVPISTIRNSSANVPGCSRPTIASREPITART